MQTQAYLLGRLTATLEHLKALPDTGSETASRNPAANLIPAIRKITQHGTDQDRDKVQALLSEMDETLLARSLPLNNDESGDYFLGYYQERSRIKGNGVPLQDASKFEQLSERMPIMLTPTMKQWVSENGGSSMVRNLIQAAMNRR